MHSVNVYRRGGVVENIPCANRAEALAVFAQHRGNMMVSKVERLCGERVVRTGTYRDTLR